jgi:hypothetical protein
MKFALKDRMMFFGAAIVGVIAVFVVYSPVAVLRARAYAVGTTPADTSTGGYDFGSSLKNLVSPFTGFINNLKLNNNSINAGSEAIRSGPIINTNPAVSGAQNILVQWLSQLDDWIYQKSGVRLSGIFLVLLNTISWTLGIAQQAVNWLLGLFH